MYNHRVFIYTLFYGKRKALGFFMLQNIVGFCLAFVFLFSPGENIQCLK